jgi:hypothetical protein
LEFSKPTILHDSLAMYDTGEGAPLLLMPTLTVLAERRLCRGRWRQLYVSRACV